MAAILTLATKDLRLLLRDRLGFFFTFFFPLIYAIFFGVLFSGASRGPESIRVVVVDEDQTAAAAEFITSLRGTPSLKVDTADSRARAADLVLRSARAAYVIVPKGFGEASERIFWGEPLRLEIGVDPGQAMTGGLIEGLVTARAYEQVQKIFTDPAVMRQHLRRSREAVTSSPAFSSLQRLLMENMLAGIERVNEELLFPGAAGSQPASAAAAGSGWQPVRVETVKVSRPSGRRVAHPQSSFAICFPQGIVWGVMACAATFAASLVVERTRGALPRLTIAPIARWQILAGKGLACFLTTGVLMTVLLGLARVGFGVRPTSVPLLALAVLCVSLAIVGLMMVFSVLGKTEQAAAGLSWAIIIVMAMIGGGMLPLAFMPAWMQPLSHVSLVKWMVLALEGAVWRGFTPWEMALPCGVLVFVGALGFAIGAGVFRWSES
jgi:ABC-2 type transport system permease protein